MQLIAAGWYTLVYLPMKNTARSVSETMYYSFFKRGDATTARGKNFLADRFVGVFIVKQFVEAVILVSCQGSAVTAAVLMWLGEGIFAGSIVWFKPFRHGETHLMVVLSETLKMLDLLIMLILASAATNSIVQQSAVFAMIVVENTAVFMFSMFCLILMCRTMKENAMYT